MITLAYAITLQKRLWKRTQITENDCWEWRGPDSDGYGRIDYCGHYLGIHRISAMLFGFKDFDISYTEPLILHKCDNRRCWNPNHLFMGTHKENIHDAMRKGRVPQISSGNQYTRRAV